MLLNSDMRKSVILYIIFLDIVNRTVENIIHTQCRQLDIHLGSFDQYDYN